MPRQGSLGLAGILVLLGGLFALLSGAYSIAADQPLISKLTNGAILSGLHGGTLDVMGVIGAIGGLVALASLARGDKVGSILGGLVGLAAPCGLSVLAIIGGLLMGR